MLCVTHSIESEECAWVSAWGDMVFSIQLLFETKDDGLCCGYKHKVQLVSIVLNKVIL